LNRDKVKESITFVGMILNERFPLIENWFFLGFLLQVFLLGIVNYRMEGSWVTVFLNSGRPTTLRARQSLDKASVAILLLNAVVSTIFLVAKFLVADFYLNTSLVIALLVTVLSFVIWYLDYLFFWFFLQQYPSKSIYEGNVWLCFLGIVFVIINFLQFFTAPTSVTLWLLLMLVFVVFCIRLRGLVIGAKISVFLWYYFILYLLTVYVVPSILISKYYKAHWFDFLTP
jgi:hypothetical protein